jgi:hypothetical protein
VVKVVASPELHAETPSYEELGQSSKDKRSLGEKSRAPLLIEVPVLEHWGM